jgi:hypothetical protein
VHVAGTWSSVDHAWRAAEQLITRASASDRLGVELPSMAVVGQFTLPPPGAVQRPFQALHIDFGLPVAATSPVDVARFTALYVDAGRADRSTTPPAATRIVSLRALFAQRQWPDQSAVADLLRQGAGPGAPVEGILGRLVESIDQGDTLPGLDDPDFQCGLEFASIAGERAYFAQHGLDLAAVERAVVLGPGEMLVFDNLSTAHGRSGIRAPGELHQLCVGYPALGVEHQQVLLSRVLSAFSANQ